MRPEIAALSRRNWLKISIMFAGNSGLFAVRQSPGTAVKPATTVREKLWLWSHVAGSYNGMFELPGKSRMTPAEAAFYMSIPNVFMLHRLGTPEPPLQQYALAFEPLREVVWGIVGEGGATQQSEREMVLALALQNPQISGVVMDDFFTGKKEGKVASLTVEEVQQLKRRLKGAPNKKLDLWVVLYTHQLDAPLAQHLKLCDVVQLWTWHGENLKELASNFEKTEKLSPGARMALGCYWWDFGGKKPLPISAMKHQCELGLQWLREGRIEAMIFCGSWLCDRGLETVAWTRRWIQQVGNQKAPGRRTA